jgi:hypothetical protein
MNSLGVDTWPEDEAKLDSDYYEFILQQDGATYAELYLRQRLKDWKSVFNCDEMGRYQKRLRELNLRW